MSQFFSQESLKGMQFESMKAAYVHLRVQAMKHGFDIGSTQSLHSLYSTFYCLKGGRQRGVKTTKTGCMWQVSLVPDEKSNTFGAVRIKNVTLEHNHELHPDIYSVFNLTESSQDLIRSMRDARIEPRKIIRVMEGLGEQGITAAQIRKICVPRGTTLGVPESEDLEQYVIECGGMCFRHITDGQYCQGVLTILPFEKENLDRFSSVMFLDGTQTQGFLNWEVIPITLIDQYRRIRSGGLCFLSSTDEETLTWLLETLFSLPPIRDCTKTLITDEDSAFIPAINNVSSIHPIRHVLCSHHKEQNFNRKLVRCGLTPVERSVAKDLFRVICYGTNREFASKAIQQLKSMSQKLGRYIDKQVIPTLDLFARSHLSETFCKGYNTTSPAESHNAMLKNYLAGRSLTLKQTRIDFTRCHVESDRSFKEVILKSFRNDHFTYAVGGLMLSPKIRKEIDEMNRTISKYCCVQLDEGKWKVFLSNAPQTSHVTSCDSCDCGRVTYEGLPCVHILRVIKEERGDDFSQWPFHLIAQEWIIQNPQHVLVPTNQDGMVEPQPVDLTDKSEEEENEVKESDAVVPSDAIDVEDGIHQVTTEDMSMMCNVPEHMKRKKRYLTLYHLAKSVVSIASRDAGNSSKLLGELTRIKRSLLSLPLTGSVMTEEFSDESEQEGVPPNEHAVSELNIVDVTDSAGRRRGRKKKSVNEKRMNVRKMREESCQLCGKAHNMTKCRRYRDFKAAVTQNQSIPDENGRHRCRMCFGIGHNTKTCPWLAANSKKKAH